MDFFDADALLESLEHSENTQIVLLVKAFDEIHILGEFIVIKRVKGNLRSPDGFHNSHFKGRSDRHNLARCFHLSAELTACADKLVKRPFRELDDNVVKRRLEASAGLSRDIVPDLVESIAESDLCRNLSDRIARSL